jgi:hypothetical protein
MADSDTSKDPEVPLDDEAKKLKLEAIKAEARKSIATAQQATLEAQLPKSDVTAPEGKIEAGENVGMVAQAVAYSALGDVAGKIAGAIPQKASVLIVDSRGLFATDWQYEMVTGDLADQKTALDNAVALFQPPKPKLGEKTPPAEGAEGREGAQDFVPGLAALSPTMTAAGSLVGALRSSPVCSEATTESAPWRQPSAPRH